MKKVKIQFKHKRMPVGYLSSPPIEIVIGKIEIDNSLIIKIQPRKSKYLI